MKETKSLGLGLNGLTWQKTVMLCAILLCAAVATYYGASVSVNISIEDRLRLIENRLDTPINSSISGLQKPCSYIISRLDSYACLQNGTTGKLDYYSTDHSKVWNFAIGNSTGGERIFARSGVYDVADIQWIKSVDIEGEGNVTVLRLKNGGNTNVLNYTPSSVQQFSSLRSIAIDGNIANNYKGNGLVLGANVWDFYVWKVWIYDTPDDGVVCSQLWGHKYYSLVVEMAGNSSQRRCGFNVTSGGNDGVFVASRFSSNSGYGFYTLGCYSCHWTDCQFSNNYYDDVYLQGNKNSFKGGYMTTGSGASSTQYDMEIAGGSWNSLLGVHFESQGSNRQYGLRMSSTAYNNTVIGCKFYNYTVNGIRNQAPLGQNRIEGCPGIPDILVFDSYIDTNLYGCGVFAKGFAGENLTAGDIVFMNSSGKYWRANAVSSATMPVTAVAVANATADSACIFMFQGYYRNDAWSWTIGGLLYVSNTTASMTHTYPASSGNQVQIVGYAVAATEIYFKPEFTVVEIV